MYTRPYNEDAHGIVIPESYGGTLLRDPDPRLESKSEATTASLDSASKNPWEENHTEKTEEVHKEETAEAFSLLSKLPFGNFLSNIGKNGKFSLQKIGTEEILIIATAAFLFFAKEGDKECAIMLLLLLFLG